MAAFAKDRTAPSHVGQDNEAILVVLQRTGIWKLFPFLLIYSIGFATLFPVIPTLVTNGFASQAAGHAVDCQLYTPATSPIECRNAHSQAVIWNSWTSFVSGSILSFVCAPFMGRLSDHWGRKPFMLMGIFLALAPMLMLMFFIWGWARIEWYYPMSALNGMVSSFSMCLTSVADLVHQAHRATTIGYLSACFSIGILIGPIFGGYISTQAAVYVCISMIGLTFAYVLCCVPETAPRVLARQQRGSAAGTWTRQAADGGEEAERQLEEPLLGGGAHDAHASHDAQGAAVPRRRTEDGVARQLGEMDFDPIPNVVPHAHEHTLLINVKGCDPAAKCSDDDDNNLDDDTDTETTSPGAVRRGGWPCKTLDMSGSAVPRAQQQQQQQQDPGGGGIPRRASKGSCVGGGGGKGKGVLAHTCADMLVGWRVIQGSPYYRKLVVIWVIVAMTWEGAQDLLMQYLQLQLGFTTRDQAHLLVVVAACGLAIKVLLLATLVRVLGEQRLLMLGLAAYMVEDVLLALAPTKVMALMAIAAGSLSCVSWPASVALQTRHADPCDMGAVQGALNGISSVATGLGPIGFAALFACFSKSDGKLPYFPQIVWYLAAFMSLIAILLTGTLHWNEPKLSSRDASKHTDDGDGGGGDHAPASNTAAHTASPDTV